jgi:predicted dehydrogenase
MSDIISSLSGDAAEEAPIDAVSGTEPQVQKQKLPVAEKKLGVALVGLGKYSEGQLGPALKETAYCRLAAVVSGNREKCEKWRVQYNLKDKNLYSYDNFDDIKSNADIDLVYIVLPNAMHAEYAIRAARAGKHVICEKPMATSVEDCGRMISACREAGVRLSIGYRLHFDPFNQEMMRLGHNQVLGSIEKIVAKDGLDVGESGQWRLRKDLAGGGPLMDVGIYCVQGAMYTVGDLPISVTARFQPKTNPAKFAEVEEGIEWEMEFPGGITSFCECSYSNAYDLLRAETVSGWFEIQPAYAYRGLKGKTSEGDMTIDPLNQQAAQMDDFALCIRNQVDTRVPGEMGMRDVQILMAIYESASTGKKVPLELQAFQNLIEI